jgi:peptide chain release factor 3
MRSDRRGDGSPVLGAVGTLQFEVVEDRMTNDFGSPVRFESLPYEVARIVDADGAKLLEKERQVEVLTRSDGALVALFSTPWRLQAITKLYPALKVGDMVDSPA